MRSAARLLIAGVALGVFAAGAPLALAGYPGRNGDIAVLWNQFDRGGDDDRELRRVSRSGQVLNRFAPCSRPETDVPTGLCPRDPAYSASGSRIAFELEGRLALSAADGSAIVRWPALTERDEDPYWSPGGGRLVFTGSQAGKRNLYVVNSNGTGLRRLTSAGGRRAAWSARGEIAYQAESRVYRLDPAAPRRRRMARGGSPDWSPSGRSVAYVLRGTAYRVPARSGARRTLLVRRARQPIFSPDAKRLLFVRPETPDLGSSLWVASSDGGRPKVLLRGGEQPIGSTWDAYAGPTWRPLP
jgi:hypothetical protein